MYIFHDPQFRATLTTILRTSQNPHVLHISGFPKIVTARRRERTSEMDLVKNTSRAGEMQVFDLEGNFSPRGSPKNPNPPTHTTDLHQMLFSYRKNPIVWPHCLGKNISQVGRTTNKLHHLVENNILKVYIHVYIVLFNKK